MPANMKTSVPGLTPIIEDMAELYLSSSKRRARDDFEIVGSSGQQSKMPSKLM